MRFVYYAMCTLKLLKNTGMTRRTGNSGLFFYIPKGWEKAARNGSNKNAGPEARSLKLSYSGEPNNVTTTCKFDFSIKKQW
jgi:hypothetical protein